jgi:thiamine pyrophosphate-dependent acetolactate synthase large subunit-like protein
MGASAATVTDAADLDAVLGAALGAGGVHLIDVKSSAAASPTTRISRHRSGVYE